ncbi:MAG: hypothetical protein SGBAC_002667 [Bacillariaceae sp.]
MTSNSKRSSLRPFRLFLVILLLLVTVLPMLQVQILGLASINRNGGVIATNLDSLPLIDLEPPSKPSTFTPDSPRFLLGIMSHDQYIQEKERRATIRSTYLSFFSKYEGGTPNRICALLDLVLEATRGNDNLLWNQCQLAYTFVVGGATTVDNNTSWNHTELLEPKVSSELLTRTPHAESDVISLNIQENGKFGKSPTWFRYVSLLLNELNEEHDQHQDGNNNNNNNNYTNNKFLQFDYVIKSDSDTLIIPKRFFRWVEEQEQEKILTKLASVADSGTNSRLERHAIYGGSAFDKEMCGFPSHEHCALLQTPVYMGGALYFVSTDLADYISSSQCPRTKLFIPHEDMTMGNYVHSYENYTLQHDTTPRKVVHMSHPEAYLSTWIHPVKNPKRMKGMWRKYIQQHQKRQQKHQRPKEGPP